MGPGPLSEADRSTLAAVSGRTRLLEQSKLRSEWLPWLPVLARLTPLVQGLGGPNGIAMTSQMSMICLFAALPDSSQASLLAMASFYEAKARALNSWLVDQSASCRVQSFETNRHVYAVN